MLFFFSYLGVKNICRDIEFMLNIKTSLYYRICWSIITPLFMAAILIYTLIEYKPLEYNGVKYPSYFYGKYCGHLTMKQFLNNFFVYITNRYRLVHICLWHWPVNYLGHHCYLSKSRTQTL